MCQAGHLLRTVGSAVGNPVQVSNGSRAPSGREASRQAPQPARRALCRLPATLLALRLPAVLSLPFQASPGGPSSYKMMQDQKFLVLLRGALCDIPRKQLLQMLWSRSRAGEQPGTPAYPHGDASLRSLNVPSSQKHLSHQQWKRILKMRHVERERCCSLFDQPWP